MNQKGKSVLVTGGAGYIGSHTCKILHQNGYTPVTFDNLSTGHRDNVQWGPFVEGDLSDVSFLEETIKQFNISSVVHFAASAYVGESILHPMKYFNNNVSGTLCLLEAMLSCQVRSIVFSSTCATFGIPDKLPIAEDADQSPINPYGESKLFLEKVLRWYQKAYGLNWVALRYFNAAGADPDGELGEQHDPETHLIPLVILACQQQSDTLAIFGIDYPTKDGTAIRDYIHVTDLARAHVLALNHLNNRGSSLALNLGTGQGYSVKEVVREVERVSGKICPVEVKPRREGDPAILIANPDRANAILKWHPEFSGLATIIETAWKWHNRQSKIK